MDTKTRRNEELTNWAVKRFTFGTSLLCVSTAEREAGSAEPALAFFEKESAKRPFGPRPGQASPTLGANRFIPKKRHPAFTGRRAGGFSTSEIKKWKGVFGVGALLPQFLAELTSTLNSRIWNYYSISARPWQA
jgi:hypothetical protein